jgi:hypothetical protein
MPDSLDPRLCRILAQKARDKAAAATDIDLRQSYLELADDYETIADTLERIRKRPLYGAGDGLPQRK